MNQSICGTSMCSPNLLCCLFCFWHHTRGCSVVRVILDPISLWSNSRGGCGVRVQYLSESTCKSGRKNLKCDLFKNLRNVCLIGSFFCLLLSYFEKQRLLCFLFLTRPTPKVLSPSACRLLDLYLSLCWIFIVNISKDENVTDVFMNLFYLEFLSHSN